MELIPLSFRLSLFNYLTQQIENNKQYRISKDASIVFSFRWTQETEWNLGFSHSVLESSESSTSYSSIEVRVHTRNFEKVP